MAEPQQPQRPPAEQRAAAIAGALAAGTTGSGGAVASAAPPVLTAAALAALTKLLLAWSFRRETVRYALRITTRIVKTPGPGATSPAPGPASEATRRAARVFAAWFIERSTARVEQRYEAGMSREDAEQPEERYVVQHIDAQEARERASERVDAEAAKPGHVVDASRDPRTTGRVILRWRAHPDDKTTPECAAADGAWFYADTPPVIGYPGMPHGGTCRCWSAHASSLAEVARGRHVNEAVRAIIGKDTDHRPHPAGREDDGRQTA